MGLLKTTHERHFHDSSTHIRFPDTINVNEHKAPTDESIRLLEEMHDKAVKNIIAKVRVEDNLVNGEVFLIHQPWCVAEYQIIFKFKINSQEFTIEHFIDRSYFYDGDTPLEMSNIETVIKDYASALMLHFTLKKFVQVAYEKISKQPFPKELLNKI